MDKLLNINIDNYKIEFGDIKNDILELTSMIDKKCLDIYDANLNCELKINKYKLLLENLIFEYHKVCKSLIKNN